MSRKALNLLIVILISSIFAISMNIPIVSGDSDTEITPQFGIPPIINGRIDAYINEWGGTTTNTVPIKTNPSDEGLNITVKTLQFLGNLYLLCQYELEKTSIEENEFLGILISETDSDDIANLTDGKIVMVSNSQDSFTDYVIQNYNFTEDPTQGSGASGAGGNSSLGGGIVQMSFEFKISLNSLNPYDQQLEYGKNYSFTIIQGNNFTFPEGILRNNSMIIKLEEPSILFYLILINFLYPAPEVNYDDLTPLLAKIIVFSIVYFCVIIYSINILFTFKKKLRRLKKI